VISLVAQNGGRAGMNANEAAAYDEAFAMMTAIDSVGNAFAAIRTADEFFGAYNQLLPEYAASAIQFALASNDAAAGALSTRLRNARLSQMSWPGSGSRNSAISPIAPAPPSDRVIGVRVSASPWALIVRWAPSTRSASTCGQRQRGGGNRRV
jgi:uncharacterized protein with beta-barrel porin domain